MAELSTKVGIFEKGERDSLQVTYSNGRLLRCNNRDLEDYEVKEGTEVICDRAFFGNKELREIFLPDSVKAIGEFAFSGCKNLVGVNIPEGVTEIKVSTFRDCNSLHTLELPASCTKIAKWVFSDGLETLICHAPSMQIDKYAFLKCKTLKTVLVPEGCINAYVQAFLPCDFMPYFEEIKEELITGEITETSNSLDDTIFEEQNKNQENNLLTYKINLNMEKIQIDPIDMEYLKSLTVKYEEWEDDDDEESYYEERYKVGDHFSDTDIQATLDDEDTDLDWMKEESNTPEEFYGNLVQALVQNDFVSSLKYIKVTDQEGNVIKEESWDRDFWR